MEVQLYGAEKVSTSQWRQFQVRLNRAWQATTEGQRLMGRGQSSDWSAKSIWWHLSNASFLIKYSNITRWQILQEVGTKATGPRSIFAKKLAQLTTAAEEEVYGAVNMTADQGVEFQVCLSDAETEPTTWCLTDIDRVVSQLEREIYGFTSNEHIQFTQELSIRLIKLKHGCRQSVFRSSGKPSNSVWSISDIERCISWAVYHSLF